MTDALCEVFTLVINIVSVSTALHLRKNNFFIIITFFINIILIKNLLYLIRGCFKNNNNKNEKNTGANHD